MHPRPLITSTWTEPLETGQPDNPAIQIPQKTALAPAIPCIGSISPLTTVVPVTSTATTTRRTYRKHPFHADTDIFPEYLCVPVMPKRPPMQEKLRSRKYQRGCGELFPGGGGLLAGAGITYMWHPRSRSQQRKALDG